MQAQSGMPQNTSHQSSADTSTAYTTRKQKLNQKSSHAAWNLSDEKNTFFYFRYCGDGCGTWHQTMAYPKMCCSAHLPEMLPG